ncbi:methyltransferase domain-containing protein [Lysobacter sp. CA196]|uniref:methyltransferase domain-containing protein n=1 Tax=Lysobacter sp. CA196 TaxID=3455606 RepID=UPI003F8CF93E
MKTHPLRAVAAPPKPKPQSKPQPLARVKPRKAGKKKGPPPPWLADQALNLLLTQYEFDSVLDVGCGDGLQARHLAKHGKRVTTISFESYGGHRPDFVGDFEDFASDERYDLVWCSHALEHQANVGQFLQRLVSFVAPGGLLAITVPPARPYIVGGHLTVWNAGLLLYNLIVAGIDCREARLKVYGYNISLIVRVRRAELPMLRHDIGDIERLAPFFPMPVQQGFDGRIEEINWEQPRSADIASTERTARSAAMVPATAMTAPVIDAGTALDPAAFLALPVPHSSDLDSLLAVARSHCPSGHVMEFGVFRGRSLSALARALPERRVHGFDTFTGLPIPWQRSAASVYPAGHFDTGALPEVPANASLWPGEFGASLPAWLDAHPGPAALLHIDCDLYESTVTVLTLIDERIVPGTVLVFDELCDWNESGVYPAWRDGEWRALREWLQRRPRRLRLLARGPKFSAAIQILAASPPTSS